MNNLFFVLVVFLFLGAIVFGQNGEIGIIPKPKSVKRMNGEFRLNFKTKIVAADGQSLKSAALLNDLLMKNYGFKLEFVSKSPKKNAIKFLPASQATARCR